MESSDQVHRHEGAEFIGLYAFEGTPHWQEFEVRRSGAAFSFEGPRRLKSELRFNGKSLVGPDPFGNEMNLHHDLSV